MRIQGTTAVITGGGSGMGEATCRLLAKLGARVAVVDRSESAALQVAKAIDGLAICSDVTQAPAMEAAFKQIQQHFNQPIGIAIHCAGVAPAKRMVGKEGPVPLSWFEEIIHINLIGTFNVMRLAAASMMMRTPQEDTQERGVIINTASIAAFEGQVGQTAYSASKGGVVAMTLPAARELAPFGIRVMTIAPGLIETPMMAGMPEKVRASLEAQTLFPKRLGQPQEFAQLVQHIISNPLLNGEVIRLDGGVRMQAV